MLCSLASYFGPSMWGGMTTCTLCMAGSMTASRWQDRGQLDLRDAAKALCKDSVRSANAPC